jgi:hypothetical protein
VNNIEIHRTCVGRWQNKTLWKLLNNGAGGRIRESNPSNQKD